VGSKQGVRKKRRQSPPLSMQQLTVPALGRLLAPVYRLTFDDLSLLVQLFLQEWSYSERGRMKEE